jgi:HSP20 family protein
LILAPWQYTLIPIRAASTPLTYPTHHHFLENTRHAIAQSLHDAFGNPIISPRCDVRETRSHYHIDIELPGITSQRGVTVRWTDRRTLLVEASKAREKIIDAAEPAEPPTGAASALKAEADHNGRSTNPQDDIHLLVKEREIGTISRAFNFPVGVSHENITAKLHHGMLKIAVPKIDEDFDH